VRGCFLVRCTRCRDRVVYRGPAACCCVDIAALSGFCCRLGCCDCGRCFVTLFSSLFSHAEVTPSHSSFTLERKKESTREQIPEACTRACHAGPQRSACPKLRTWETSMTPGVGWSTRRGRETRDSKRIKHPGLAGGAERSHPGCMGCTSAVRRNG
jgi:hypothetical protein